jgi:aspartyl/asparaginyl beta-hydroxylase (cupin superfamily)
MDLQALGRAGTTALQAGDAATARRCFEQIVARGPADASTWLALAMACQSLKDGAAMLAALDKVLAIESHNLRALIMKGDHLVATGNERAAAQFYRVAVTVASQVPNLPAPLAEAARHADAARKQIIARVEAYLQERLLASGYNEQLSSERFTQSLDLLLGRKEIYFQQPRAYYFPELPQIQFYPRSAFPWLDAVEAATDEICAELAEVLKSPDVLVPYVQPSADATPGATHRLLNNLDWSAFFLWKDGAPVPENAERCPRTLAALADAPLGYIKGRTPSILFSVLRPGARILPHTGYLNTRLICHLPLIVPPGCRFRVGNDEREWERGKAWVFDDTIEHEAWNPSDQLRVVLIFDIWRPELTDEERRLVAVLMEAVNSYGMARPANWDA